MSTRRCMKGEKHFFSFFLKCGSMYLPSRVYFAVSREPLPCSASRSLWRRSLCKFGQKLHITHTQNSKLYPINQDPSTLIASCWEARMGLSWNMCRCSFPGKFSRTAGRGAMQLGKDSSSVIILVKQHIQSKQLIYRTAPRHFHKQLVCRCA